MWSRFTEWVSTHKVISIAAVVVVLGAGTAIFMMASAEPDVTTTTSAATDNDDNCSASTTTEAPTTTIAGALSPINGLPVDDPELLDRRLLAVKNDNHPNARPQSGIDVADAVFEYMAEGVTRFMSFWQQSDERVSGTDAIGTADRSDHSSPSSTSPPSPSPAVRAGSREMIANVGVHIIGEVEPATFRVSGRRAPHNLYTNTVLLREYADEQGYPDEPIDGPMWEFGPMREDAERQPRSPSISSATRSSGPGMRPGHLAAHARRGRVELGDRRWRGGPDRLPRADRHCMSSNTSVGDLPTSRTTGQGLVYVFADGKVVQGTWNGTTSTEWFTLADNDGEHDPGPPGPDLDLPGPQQRRHTIE